VNACFGAQIDMRQVYLTVGGTWGQLLVGRELGLFNRQNILTDQTLFGVGATGNGTPGDGFGTTLGRIGFGYIYPNFRAQITYSTAAGKPAQFSIGVFEAASVGDYKFTQTPRLEAEFVYSGSSFKGWLGGTVQSTKNAPTGGQSMAGYGGSGGLRYQGKVFSLTASGYGGKGIGTTLYGIGGSADNGAGSDDARKSYGFIGQATFSPQNSKITIAGSYGSSYLEQANSDPVKFKTENTLVSGGLYYQATKSLKVVAEFDYWWTKGKINGNTPAGQNKNEQWAPAIGFMLFF
jgi:hypothetical protein